MDFRLLQGVNFTNILWAVFAPKSFRQKITNTNCKHLKAVQITSVWLSISPIFYKQLFHTKVICAPFMCLQFGFVIFWRKDFGAKAAHKMLVKLTPGVNFIKFLHAAFLISFCTQLIATCKWQWAQLSATCEWHNQNNFCTKNHGELCFQKQAAFFVFWAKKLCINMLVKSTQDEFSTLHFILELIDQNT